MKARMLTLLAVLIALATAGPASARAFETGFFDDQYLGGDATTWFDRTAQAGAGVVRLDPHWSSVAPATRPQGFHPTDPGDPAYNWTATDAAVRGAAARHLDIVFTINGAPPWAEGAQRPKSAAPGSWRPSPTQLAAFARAAATRYSGSYPDPLAAGATLPRVRLWQIWNEPNLTTYLAPQWTRSHGRWTAFSPARYRAMLNASYASIKAVHSDNVVGTAGTAPYGDPQPGGSRIMPVAFDRKLLSRRTRLDALSHHPYGVRAPTSHALNRDDAAVPDVVKLARVLKAAQRAGHVTRSHKRLWVTEISWDSRPPDPQGIPAATQARWLAQSFYVLWRQSVDLITWFRIRDQERGQGYPFTNQSGVYLVGGRPKPSLQAFEFPFVVDGRRVWGVAPAAGSVAVQRRAGSRWRRVITLGTGGGRVFTRRLKRLKAGTYRAAQGTRTSRSWRVR